MEARTTEPGGYGELLPVAHGLIVWDKDGDPVEYELRAERVGLGRGRHNQIRLRCEHLSSEHLEFVRCGTGYEMRDLGSRNGTKVNGTETRLHVMRDGDRLLIGGRVAAHYLMVPEWPGEGKRSVREQRLEVAMVHYLDLSRRLESLEDRFRDRIGGADLARGGIRLEDLLRRVERLERAAAGEGLRS
jgi:hypothetical protein